MKYNPDIHHRRSIRLKGYDYSQNGLYFITICTQNRYHLFGTITNDQMALNPIGKIAHDEWLKTESMRPNIRLHEFIVMPNHIHGIIEIIGALPHPVRAHCMGPLDIRPPPQSVPPITIPHLNNLGAGNNNLGVGNTPLRWVILYGVINPLLPNTLMYYAIPPVCLYGNAITMNISFVTKPPI